MPTKFGVKDRDSSPRGGFSLKDRIPASKSSSCRVRVWHYVKQNFGAATNVSGEVLPFEDLLEVEEFDIVSDVSAININKNINNPSATFSISLLPTKNWKGKISPGDWLAIFLYSSYGANKKNNETKNLVLLGNVDRITKNAARDEDTDKLTVRYNVTGRNFGKVFENTDIWYDPYQIQKDVIDVILRQAGLRIQGNPSELVNAILDIFLGPGYVVDGINKVAKESTEPLKQWKIPSEIVSFIGSSGSLVLGASEGYVFYDILNREIEEDLPGQKIRGTITPGDHGNVWGYLERNYNNLVNELFLEEIRSQDGNVIPTITLRPKPLQTIFFENQFVNTAEGFKPLIELNGKYKTLHDHSKENFVEISQSEILYENIGKGDEGKVNFIYLHSGYKDVYRSTSSQDIGNPFVNRNFIHRDGLRALEQNLDFIVPEREARGKIEIDLFKGFLTQIYDLHFVNHIYENGTIECTGVLEAELGKALVIPSTDDSEDKKMYYIEGYQHAWQYPSTWRTTFEVSHGQFQNESNPFIDVAQNDAGLPDTVLSSNYVAKTIVKRDGIEE